MPTYRNIKGRFRTPTPSEKEKDVDIRSATDVSRLSAMLKNGSPTFILIYADWCGHCHRYLPTWSQLESTPGRTANMARVHYDMQEHIPAIKDATIQGYPSVIKVLPDGRIQSYASEGGPTNAMPMMRDEAEMQSELRGGSQRGGGIVQQGGVVGAFTAAIQETGPAALLMLANAVFASEPRRRSRTYRTPKRASRRASTRRSRRT